VVGSDVVDVNTDAIIEWSPEALGCLTLRILSEWDAVLDRPRDSSRDRLDRNPARA
jgi:hypothetical protein